MNDSNQQIDRIAGSIAGAFVDAVREGLLRSQQSETTATSNAPASTSSSAPATTPQRTSAPESSTAFQRALQLQASLRRDRGASSSNSASRPLFPSAFCRPAKRGKRSAMNTPVGPRPSVYVRDIICLPKDYVNDEGTIHIPRGSSRTRLAEAHLFGKIEFTSAMPANEIKIEICRAFMQPMGLCEDDLETGKLFPFHYLQRTGAGSRSLCMPAVSNSFQWNGRQVASLCKSGGFMYILADEELPGFNSLVTVKEVVLSSSEDETQEQTSEFITVSSDETSKDDDDDPNNVHSSDTVCDLRGSSSVDGHLSHSTTADSSASTSANIASHSLGTSENISKLNDLFMERLSTAQIKSIYEASGSDFGVAMDCLLKGPTLEAMLNMIKKRFSQFPTTKVHIDAHEAWEDLVAFYKSMKLDVNNQLRIQISGQPVIDVGGVRAQLYTAILDGFSQNKKIKLFEGPPRRLRPHCTAESRSSGLFKVLGTMVGHALLQDGIGFPFLSPLCFWYIADGEEKALQHLNIGDVGEDVSAFLTEIRDASSAEELNTLMSNEHFFVNAMDIMGRCGIKDKLTLSTKSLIFQDVMMYEGLYKLTMFLDQFCDGLKKSGAYDIISAFPQEFFNLFTYTKLDSMDVLDALYILEQEMEEGDDIIVSHLFRYIRECDEPGLRQFLCHITGNSIPVPRSIKVEVEDTIEWGSIVAQTCTGVIIFPRKVFTCDNESYEVFKASLKAVTSGSPLSFNTV